MDEIANQLGISKKTIYQSFADKDELVLEVFNNHICQSKNKCLHNREDAQNAVHEIFLASEVSENILKSLNASILFDLEKYHPKTFQQFKAYKYDFLYHNIADNLKRGIEEDIYRNDINIDVITRMRLSTILLSWNTEIYPPGQYKLMEVEHHIQLHFLYGIVNSKGFQLIQEYSLQRQKIKA